MISTVSWKFLAFSSFLLASVTLYAQDPRPQSQPQDLVIIEQADTTLIETKSTLVPRRASLYSAVLPGLGQAYNRSYWKIPIIYGGFAGLGYAVWWNNDQYQEALRLLRADLDDDPNTVNTSNFSTEQLSAIAESLRRDRDFSIVLFGVLYMLNIVDAHIDAHLKEFEINEDLSVQLNPAFQNFRGIGTVGFSIKLVFP